MTGTTFEPICDELPIFRLDEDDGVLFYAPGYLVVAGTGQAEVFTAAVRRGEQDGEAGVLRRRASKAVTALADWSTQPFDPLCLTLFLHDGCNLRCAYCVSDPRRRPTRRIALHDIRSAASLVVDACVRHGVPMTLVCHGGGEPTLDPGYLFAAVETVEAIAAAQGVPMTCYLATNGVMSERVARAVAERFDLIGLSCDGPEPVQATQRPLRSMHSSTPFVESTADVIHEVGTPLHVRTTVLPETYQFLADITEYLCRRLRPAQLAVEPIYIGGRATRAACPTLDDAVPMAEAFLEAEAIARSHGVRWETSGSRLGEVHGAYCNVFRNVLNLVPGGAATACFKTQDTVSTMEQGVAIGAPSPDRRRFVLNEARVDALRAALDPRPGCDGCFNRFHCVRTCPDQCPVAGPVTRDSFRCRFQQAMTMGRLRTAAAGLDRADGAPRGTAL